MQYHAREDQAKGGKVIYRTAIGIDPGASGAIALIHSGILHTVRMSETAHDVAAFLRNWQEADDAMFAFVEQVHSMPKQGVSSSFKFGTSYGFLKGLLTGMKIPFEEVTPQRWQKAMGCMTRGDKNVSKRKAQQLFPMEKIFHWNADALLIAEFCRRTIAMRSHPQLTQEHCDEICEIHEKG